jgi:membrane protease YdiL (CAAX protease family)
MLVGYAAGLLLILPLVAALLAMNLRVPSTKLLNSATPLLYVAKLIGTGLLTGWVVAFVEETFCRGALFAAIQRESGLALAALLSTLLYTATHFLGAETKLPYDHYTYVSGLQVAAKLFERFAHPIDFVDSFLALAAIGTLLMLIRLRTGAIAMGIGVHAGAVTIITAVRRCTSVNTEGPLSWLVGSYDGIVGWLAFAWIGTVAFLYWRLTRKARAEQPSIASVPIN